MRKQSYWCRPFSSCLSLGGGEKANQTHTLSFSIFHFLFFLYGLLSFQVLPDLESCHVTHLGPLLKTLSWLPLICQPTFFVTFSEFLSQGFMFASWMIFQPLCPYIWFLLASWILRTFLLAVNSFSSLEISRVSNLSLRNIVKPLPCSFLNTSL